MTDLEAYGELKEKLSSREWRLCNLYSIINKHGANESFTPNEFQRTLLVDNLWYLNIILKARQLGMSTGIDIFLLDMCLFNSNTNAGIIDYTLDDAKNKLAKCKHAYNHLPQMLKDSIQLIKDNEQELKFSNGSRITADTSFRGSTLQILHISELAKIAKRDPIKAREIRTGALNAIAPGQFVFIESTAEDGEGDFYEITQRAEKLSLTEVELTKLDYKFFFFPWWKDSTYSLTKPQHYQFSTESSTYFSKLELAGISLSQDQKFWYIKKKEEQDQDMKKEYPSTSKEAFEAVTEDKYYQSEMMLAISENRVQEFEIDRGLSIDITLDLGLDDYTSVIFDQQLGKEVRIVDYFEINRVDVAEISGEITAKGYRVRFMWLPHDAFHKRLGMGGKSIADQFEDYGFKVKAVPGPQEVSFEAGVSLVRKYFGRLWFKESKTAVLRNHVEKYSKKWSEASGQYVGPKHNEHSHASDCLRYLVARYKEPGEKKIINKVIKSKYKPMGGYSN